MWVGGESWEALEKAHLKAVRRTQPLAARRRARGKQRPHSRLRARALAVLCGDSFGLAESEGAAVFWTFIGQNNIWKLFVYMSVSLCFLPI